MIDLRYPAESRDFIFDVFFSEVASFSMFYPKTKSVFCSGQFQGTTFTGAPTTTVGNTLRTIAYVNYITDLARLTPPQFKLFVAGDDVVILL